jgi:hypothetical protein
MGYTVRDVQARVASLGFNPGVIDGWSGKNTNRAVAAAMEARGVSRIEDLFHESGLRGVVWHWTAGRYGTIAMERKAYNGLHDQNGERHDGDWRPEAQARYRAGVYGASHTRNMNTGWIGESCDAMAGARERPLVWGPAPLTWPQVHSMLRATAEHCRAFDIPNSRFSTLGHAEVERTLGVKQKNKWDFTVLPGDTKVRDAIECGDVLREMLEDYL